MAILMRLRQGMDIDSRQTHAGAFSLQLIQWKMGLAAEFADAT
ncbi:hypothetical protein [Mesorhizobium sp.]|nr:hypothetical protein [Mesorhizobium sp.]